MSTAPVILEPRLVKLIDYKASVECGDTALLHSSTFIQQLNDHINGTCNLADNEIASKVDYLAGCLTITLDMPMQGLELLRVRRCKEGKFDCVKQLSYIKNTTEFFPSMGRLNQTGQALFYAAIAVKKDDTALRVALSEAGAKDLDRLNVIRSHQKKDLDLNLRVLGIWNQVRRNERPYYLSNHNFDYCRKAKEYMGKKFDPRLLSAYELTDRFFAEILSSKGSEALYQVTSAISSIFFDGDSCEGILYSSVEAKGEPIVALKPKAVDDKLQHKLVTDIAVQQCFGYEFFEYETLGQTVQIDSKDGEIVW